jgi:hypothetical protein
MIEAQFNTGTRCRFVEFCDHVKLSTTPWRDCFSRADLASQSTEDGYLHLYQRGLWSVEAPASWIRKQNGKEMDPNPHPTPGLDCYCYRIAFFDSVSLNPRAPLIFIRPSRPAKIYKLKGPKLQKHSRYCPFRPASWHALHDHMEGGDVHVSSRKLPAGLS